MANKLRTIVIDATARHTASMIWLHGLGDVADGWASEIRGIFSRVLPHVKFICPTAPVMPVTLNGGMRMTAWHDIKSLHEIDGEDFAGLDNSVSLVQNLLEQEISNGIPSTRIMIGGFSQGAATSLYTGYTYNQKLAGIVSLSGYLPKYRQFEANEVNKNTPGLACHGTADPVVNIEFGRRSVDLLQGQGVPIELKQYRGLQHSSSIQEMQDVLEFVNRCLPQEE
eukprot:TRINITY_DN2150_c0_g2_i3.p1 TRINITY_DN2150_c0_g2~~TRINITY_DN2150_c0_g2_i3.p1  ORF type:complete len:250 (-),score=82.95 TRINITY_DN2150_c0_g2_i3:199-873(-)